MKQTRILSLVCLTLLCCLFCLGAMGEVVDSGTCGENLTWELDDKGVLTVKGSGPMNDYLGWNNRKEEFRQVILNSGVTSVGKHAFARCTSLTSVTIPGSVTGIGEYAFNYCTDLESVMIPGSVTSIGQRAFASCNSLTSVTIGDSAAGKERQIGAAAFIICSSLKNVTIGFGVTSIGDDAFSSCTSLTSLTIPDSVTSIEENAFNYCTSLTSVTIPGSVTSIGKSAFQGCTSLTSVTIGDGEAGKERQIDAYAFYNCIALTSVTIGSGVTSIGQDAFTLCTSLGSTIIPGSVTSIGENAFKQCTSLTSVTIGDGEAGKERQIGVSAFYNCWLLTSVTIGSGVTRIGTNAIGNCSALKDIYYCGTQTAWDRIEKEQFWDLGTPGDKTIHVFTFTGAGAEAEPYQIRTTEDWDTLADYIANGSFDTGGKHFLLDARESLSVSTMIGTEKNPFKGTFDGNGKTLTVSIQESGTNSSNQYAAPFRWIRGATIRNLYVEGTVTAVRKHSAGLVGAASGSGNLIENCWVAVENRNGDEYAGGILGHGQGKSAFKPDSTTIRGCVFSGSISVKEMGHAGTIWGWSSYGATAVIEDCLDLSNCGYPVADRSNRYSDESRFSNLYYTLAEKKASPAGPNGIIPGKLIHTVETAKNVNLEKGTETRYYDVSGITAYRAGIEYEGQFYAGKDDELLLNPDPKPKDTEYVRYLGDDNQPLARGTGKTWLMPGRNVTVRAEVKPIEAYGTPTFTLPAGTNTIGRNAFAGIAAQVVYVPGSDNPYPIGERAFASCPNLAQIRLPKNCDIDGAAFWGCPNLTAIYAPGGGSTEDWAKENGYGFKAE